jgi:hypothetical protein
MWDKLVEWIMVVVNKVREIWVKYINAGKAMRKRADKLSERLDKGLGEKTKDTVGGSFVQQLTIAAKPDFEKTIALAEEADRRGKDLAVNGKRNMENAVHAVTNAYNSNTDQNKIAAKFDANADFNFGTKTDKALKSLFPEGASNAQAYCVPGNGYLATYTKVAKEAVTGTNAVAAVEVACMRFKTISENSGDKKLDTLAEAAMRKAIKAIYKYGSALETVIKDFEKYASIASSLKDAAKTASEKVENAKDDAGKETGRVARVIATEAMANFNASRSVFAHTCRNGGFGLIGYVQASLGAYKAA